MEHLVELMSRAPKFHAGKSDAKWAAEGRYNYPPSFVAAVIFLALYAAVSLTTTAQYFYYRTWFWWSMLFGISMELAGYLARVLSVKNLESRDLFIVQTVMILVAPAVLAASCYMAFGRVLLYVTPPEYQTARHLWIPARRITPLFVTFDVLSFFIQVVGGVIISSADTPDKLERGRKIIQGGLIMQLACFGFFVVASFRFQMVLRKLGKKGVVLATEVKWRRFLWTVNIASVVILLRSVYRFIEYSIGLHNALSDKEVFFYTLDATLVFLVVLSFVVFHPGNYIPYIAMRRRKPQWSKNAGKGPFAGLARGESGGMIPLHSSHGHGQP